MAASTFEQTAAAMLLLLREKNSVQGAIMLQTAGEVAMRGDTHGIAAITNSRIKTNGQLVKATADAAQEKTKKKHLRNICL